MTAVSLINPYAPQPVVSSGPDLVYGALHSSMPAKDAATGNDTGSASDQSGQGAGNGTGTGGAQLATLLKKGRNAMPIQQPTPKSVVEAQSESDPASEFLERRARLQIEAKAAEDQRAAARAEQTKVEAAQAAEPEYVMPNPLPTAPILQRDDS